MKGVVEDVVLLHPLLHLPTTAFCGFSSELVIQYWQNNVEQGTVLNKCSSTIPSTKKVYIKNKSKRNKNRKQ